MYMYVYSSRRGTILPPKVMLEKCLWNLFLLVFLDDARLPVAMEDFEDYVKMMHANTDHLFSEEYEVDHVMSCDQ